jgi:hypothetical protein
MFFIALIFVTALNLLACQGKDGNSTFIFKTEGPPETPVITGPTTSSTYISNLPTIVITGCYNLTCGPNASHVTIQASGTGVLATSDTGFTFTASMVDGETRAFSFTATNVKGVVSSPAVLNVTLNVQLELSPMSTLFLGGVSTDTPVVSSNGNFQLNFLTSLSSVMSGAILSNRYVYTSGALNPQ